MELSEIANALKVAKEKVILIYAFNSIGKTRLSVAYKDATKNEDGEHTGVYYNAFSEDLFVWNNDEENDGANIRLNVIWSSLNQFHTLLTEKAIREKLISYRPRYDFSFNLNINPERGIDTISFFLKDSEKENSAIKISRGEERIFVWCFFLALFEVEDWADKQSSHFFIDDPVSSLDDHNIFITATTLINLIDNHYKNRKIIITTHHIGFATILSDWLKRGEKADKYKKITKVYVLSNKSGALSLVEPDREVLLYHLSMLQVLDQAEKENKFYAFHFALLRQILENISSFLGVGRINYVLEQIGIDDKDEVNNIINVLSHKKVYYYESDKLVPENEELLKNIFNKVKDKYSFVLHAS
ncbi:MAG: AAA family ATPase [Desulfobulbaceae bacterium]|nr:AAA family ATPase [Desulfobulbaceae bacterium]